MTYEYLINKIREAALAHTMVDTIGYGQISDIAVPDTEKPADYPYVFINPVSVDLNTNVFSATLNIICMTQTFNDNLGQTQNSRRDSFIIEGQSKCMQILNDILAHFNFNQDDPIVFDRPISMIPFVERFQDEVVGATATVTFRYAKAMSNCNSLINV